MRADRVGLVDHQERLVPLLDFDELRQIGEVAVHAVDAFDDDQHAAIFAARISVEQLVERLPIVVRERPAAGAGEDRALDDAVVRQRVVQDQVAGAEQVADRPFRSSSARRRSTIASSTPMKSAMAAFQLAVQRLLARDQPAGRNAGAVAVDGFLRGLGDRPDRPTCRGSCSWRS